MIAAANVPISAEQEAQHHYIRIPKTLMPRQPVPVILFPSDDRVILSTCP
jgi:hypothetical protein